MAFENDRVVFGRHDSAEHAPESRSPEEQAMQNLQDEINKARSKSQNEYFPHWWPSFAGSLSTYGAGGLVYSMAKELPAPAPVRIGLAAIAGVAVGGTVNNHLSGRSLLSGQGFLADAAISGALYVMPLSRSNFTAPHTLNMIINPFK